MTDFLPINRADMEQRGWYYCDFLLVTGDAYIDHPSFGTAVISRVLEAAGFRVAILSQPDFRDPHDFLAMGKPRYAVLVNAGNIDSMVAHYTAAKKRRHDDAYTPGGGPTAPLRSTPCSPGGRSPIPRFIWVDWRRPCAGLHTMTIGRIRSCRLSSFPRARTG